jgi:hypothetical protein
MKIIIRKYNDKGKLIGRRLGNRDNWKKLYGKLASPVAHTYVVRVEYGYEKDVSGKKVLFHNEYEGNSLQEAKQALSAFMEL